MIWRDKLQQHANKLCKEPWYPFFIIGSVLIYGINLPGLYNDVGFVFFYPIYGGLLPVTLFTMGTWQAIYGIEYFMRTEADYIYNKAFFKFYTVGSLFIYLCHDLWITVIATYIIIPNLKKNNSRVEGINFGFACFIMIFGVEFLSNLTYYLFVKLFMLCRCRKKRKGRNSKTSKEKQ